MHLAENLDSLLILDRSAIAQERIERGAEAVNVASSADEVEPASGLLGAHVRGRADRPSRDRLGDATARLGTQSSFGLGACWRDVLGVPDDLRQSPIDDKRLAILAEHDVARLEVAMQHAAAVCVGDRVAHVDEAAQQAAKFQRAEI
jgi:hypothetical protein